ncbi:MAG: hypothetical protein QXF15_00965 [Candidatus Aenigmatarchaeota archaeon]
MKNLYLIIIVLSVLIISSIGLYYFFNTNEKEGCLYWACPSLVGAKFPDSCIPKLCDKTKSSCIDLEFDSSTQHLRNTLNNYYSESFSRCVRIKVTGNTIVLSCPPLDQACVTTYKFKVTNLTII